MFANSQFYTEEYGQGCDLIIPPAQFAFWEERARWAMNPRKIALLPVPQEVALCCCQVAEQLYTHHLRRQTGNIKSQKVDSYTLTYTGHTQTQGEIAGEIQQTIAQRLGGTPWHNTFVFQGV